MKIKTAFAIYTGGSIWAFYGELNDGNFFFTDDYGDTLIVDENPGNDFDDTFDPVWQEKHLVEELSGENRKNFCKEMLEKIKSYPYSSENRGGIEDYVIDRYSKSMEEIV